MKLDYSPKCVSWIYKKGQPELLVAMYVDAIIKWNILFMDKIHILISI